jgi:hypothetical protein
VNQEMTPWLDETVEQVVVKLGTIMWLIQRGDENYCDDRVGFK